MNFFILLKATFFQTDFDGKTDVAMYDRIKWTRSYLLDILSISGM